jgi:hypothetical protein
VGLSENIFCIFMHVEEKGILEINRLKMASDCVNEEQYYQCYFYPTEAYGPAAAMVDGIRDVKTF